MAVRRTARWCAATAEGAATRGSETALSNDRQAAKVCDENKQAVTRNIDVPQGAARPIFAPVSESEKANIVVSEAVAGTCTGAVQRQIIHLNGYTFQQEKFMQT